MTVTCPRCFAPTLTCGARGSHCPCGFRADHDLAEAAVDQIARSHVRTDNARQGWEGAHDDAA